MGLSRIRSNLRSLLLLVRASSFSSLGPILAFGHVGTGVVGGIFGCPFSVPFILCPICPAQCVFNLVQPWLFGIVVSTSLLMGRVFCGLLCPIGTVSDLLHRVPVQKLAFKSVKGRLVYLKYGALILFLYLMFEATFVLLGILPGGVLWSLLTKYRGGFVIVVFTISGILLVSSIFVYRPWCRYVCPIGTLISASNRLSFLRMGRNPDACGECDACRVSCPQGISDPDSANCMRCLSCYSVCRKGELKIEIRRWPGKRES